MVRSQFVRLSFFILAIGLSFQMAIAPAEAAVDAYVARYLKATEPIALKLNDQGEERSFSPTDLTQGKQLFEENCMNCHVGGATLPDPTQSLALDTLKGAIPARDNINNLVAYFRHPVSYDGTEDSFWCREVPSSWLSQSQVENLAAFILRAAEIAPGWGTSQL